MTLDEIINAKITNALMAARITSANPTHINYVIDTKGFGVMGGRENMDDLIDALIEQKMSELQPAGTGGEETTTGGFKPMDILAGASRGRGGSQAIIGSIMKMIPYLGPILVAAGVAAYLFDWAKGAGGPLDTRYRRELLNEQFNFLSRQLARDTEIGNRQLIIQSDANFRNLGGAGNSNTLRQVREKGDRLADVGLLVDDRAKGLERLS